MPCADPCHRSPRESRRGHDPRPDRGRPPGHRLRPRCPRVRRRQFRRALFPGRPHRSGRRVRGRARPGRGHPLRGDAGADAQRAPQGVRQQPDGDVQSRRGVRPCGRGPAGQRLQRDRRRDGVRRATVPRAVRPDRRGAGEPPAGPLRAGQGLRRATDGRRRRALGPARDLDPAVLGPVGGQLRAQPRAVAAQPLRRRGEPELLELHRRLRPRARAAARRGVFTRPPRRDVHRLARQRDRQAAGGADRAPLRRGRLRPRPAARGRRRDHQREGRAADRLPADALVARLPVVRRGAARARARAPRARPNRRPARPRGP